MTPLERRATLGLSLIFALRMLGLFMILPVFALYAGDLAGVTPLTLGLALGIYGLTQALLQLPFGLLSDRLGRKPVIIAGLLIFAAGSVLAAQADDIHWVVAGRALQGAGAIGAVINALLADLTREQVRTTAMAVLGISIGGCFLLAMVLG
ncbi:MAG: MFS transporter, partial [Nevskiales bacterium]